MRNLIAALSLLVPSAFAEEAPNLTPAADKAVAAYEAQVEKAHKIYIGLVRSEQEKLVVILHKEMDALTKKGDLDGAIAIKDKIAVLAKSVPDDAVDQDFGSAPELVIVKAKYGTGDRFVDITTYLRKVANPTSLLCDIKKIHDEVGDPAPFAGKVVIIDYILGGKKDTAIVPEGTIIRIGAVPGETTRKK